MPSARPTTAAAVAQLGDVADDAADMVRRWDVGGEHQDAGSGPGECGRCGGPVVWEPAQTALVCPACDAVTLPPDVAERYAAASTAVAIRPDRTAERKTRLALAVERSQMVTMCTTAMGRLDTDGLEIPWDLSIRAANHYAVFEDLWRQTKEARDSGDLGEIRELMNQCASDAHRDLAMIDQVRRMEHRRDMAYDYDGDIDDEPSPRTEIETDRFGVANGGGAPPVGTLVAIAQAMAERREAKQRNGICEMHRWGYPPATILVKPVLTARYWHPHQSPSIPEIRCCPSPRCRTRASERLAEQGYARAEWFQL